MPAFADTALLAGDWNGGDAGGRKAQPPLPQRDPRAHRFRQKPTRVRQEVRRSGRKVPANSRAVRPGGNPPPTPAAAPGGGSALVLRAPQVRGAESLPGAEASGGLLALPIKLGHDLLRLLCEYLIYLMTFHHLGRRSICS